MTDKTLSQHLAAARAARGEKNAAAARANGAKGGRPRGSSLVWLVVATYDYASYKRGDVVSRHSSYELAERAAKNNSFVAIKKGEL